MIAVVTAGDVAIALSALVRVELVRMARDGFAGIRGEVIAVAVAGDHQIALTEYAFPDGGQIYVEFAECHDGYEGARILPISEAVHLARNVTGNLFWRTVTREAQS